eukprot:TRINITY_DN136756_c0_g1_i1.p1 TRINITY_DN136756_c0_g1~~TRINITY_DN136756_c0_g1_i1.p1  ORF type:complete len:164 (+),score=63.79 TRINITY_DN136756_c0_g1_i1:45-536(+)
MSKPKPISRITFDKYDKDGSGSITREEFKNLCYDMGHYLSDQELTLAMATLDRNGSGRIDYDEYLKWWSTEDRWGKLHLDEQQLQALTQASNYFRYFDKDNSGSLDHEEFKKLHADLVKNKWTTKSVEACLADLDSNNDGHIEFNEYVEWLVRLGSLPIKVIH